MDPRPYHFQFRKPRLSNPTLYQIIDHLYQSVNLYDSIYQLNKPRNNASLTLRNPQTYRYSRNMQSQKPSSQPDYTYKRNQSMDLVKPAKVDMVRYPSKHQIPRPASKQKLVSLEQNQKNTSKLSNYGYNLMKNGGSTVIDQKQIFDKQQHAFDIISYHPTQYRARLKMFPKLTLQDKINQRYGSPLRKNL